MGRGSRITVSSVRVRVRVSVRVRWRQYEKGLKGYCEFSGG